MGAIVFAGAGPGVPHPAGVRPDQRAQRSGGPLPHGGDDPAAAVRHRHPGADRPACRLRRPDATGTRVQLFLHGGDFGVTDPQFGKDLGFYAFDLPFYRLVLGYLFVATFLAFIANLVGHYLFGGIRLSGRTGALSRSARIQLVSLVGILVLLKAVAYWLDRYELLSHTRSGKPFTGAGYTDINAVLPAKLILMAIAVICAAAVFSAIVLRDLRIPAIGVVLLLLSVR